MGNKSIARRIAEEAGVPVVPGSENAGSADEAVAAAGEIGYPVMVKAAAGGGGRGIRVAANEEELRKAVQIAKREAESAFGDGTLYLEKLLVGPRHVEVQVIGDHGGNVIHLYERECSMQRHRQKVIEEAPSPGISPESAGENDGGSGAAGEGIRLRQAPERWSFWSTKTRTSTSSR